MTRARRSGGVSRHAGRAAAAASTAASMSAALQNGTVRITVPVAGLVTWPWRELAARCVLPPIQSGILAAFGASTGLLMAISCSAHEGPALSHHHASQRGLVAHHRITVGGEAAAASGALPTARRSGHGIGQRRAPHGQSAL